MNFGRSAAPAPLGLLADSGAEASVTPNQSFFANSTSGVRNLLKPEFTNRTYTIPPRKQPYPNVQSREKLARNRSILMSNRLSLDGQGRQFYAGNQAFNDMWDSSHQVGLLEPLESIDVGGTSIKMREVANAGAFIEACLFDKTKRHLLDPDKKISFILSATKYVLAKNNKFMVTPTVSLTAKTSLQDILNFNLSCSSRL